MSVDSLASSESNPNPSPDLNLAPNVNLSSDVKSSSDSRSNNNSNPSNSNPASSADASNAAPEWPAAAQERAHVLYNRGFGFEPSKLVHGEFVVCQLLRNNRQLPEEDLRVLCGVRTLRLRWPMLEDNPVVCLHWTEHAKIPHVLNQFLTCEVGFRLHNCLEVQYPVREDEKRFNNNNTTTTTTTVGRFSTYSMELEAIREFKELAAAMDRIDPRSSDRNCQVLIAAHPRRRLLLDLWNWESDQGQRFCQELRFKLNLPPGRMDDREHNYRLAPIFANCDYATLLDRSDAVDDDEDCALIDTSMKKEDVVQEQDEDEKQPQEEESDEITECMICLTATPDTCVLPCMHRVVCRECSLGLKATEDRGKCVRCRVKITNVLVLNEQRIMIAEQALG